MFCPKCGVRNYEGVKFCRACGADIRLVPQALAGSLPEKVAGGEVEGKKRAKSEKPPTLEKGIESIFGGIAFLIILVLGYFYFPNAFWIWVWFIIPGLEGIGKGIGQIIRSRQTPPALAPADAADSLRAAPPRELAAPPTSEIIPPPASVTETTTRDLAGRQ